MIQELPSISVLIYSSFSVEMNVSTARLKRTAWNWKTKRNWLFIFLFLVVFFGFLYYASGPLFMEKTKHGKEPTQNNIAFVMQLKQSNAKRLVYRFQQCLASICQHASIGLTIHIFANSLGKDESTKVLDVLTAECFNGLRVKLYDIERVILKLLPFINIIKDAIEVRGRNHPSSGLYYLPIFMDRILPKDVTRVLLLDADFFFFTDIKQLFDQFENFKDTTIFGLALMQQPTYKVGFAKYRKEHPGTKMGDSPPDGVTGYNGGLSLIHLSNMRRSTLYKQILFKNEMKNYAEKYQFRGGRAEQDFFVLLDAEHHDELFYVVPCQWNRQLCRPKTTGIRNQVDYDLYHSCTKPFHAYHGNCNADMPTMENPYKFD